MKEEEKMERQFMVRGTDPRGNVWQTWVKASDIMSVLDAETDHKLTLVSSRFVCGHSHAPNAITAAALLEASQGDECHHVWASNTGADYGGYRPSEVVGLKTYCVKCGMNLEDTEHA